MTNPTMTDISAEDLATLNTRFSAARTKLIAYVPFFGYLCLNLRMRVAKPEDNVPTAAVARDGSLILNHEFCSKLNDAELCGLLCHEVLHPALFCWDRMGSRSAIVSGPHGERFSLWNLAHDLSFNGQILELAKRCGAGDSQNGVALPPGGAHDPNFDGKSAEEIYDALLAQAIQNKKDGKGGKGDPSLGILTKFPGGGHAIGDDMRDDLAETAEGQAASQGDTGAAARLENEWRVNILAAAMKHETDRPGQGTLPGGIQKLIDEIRNPRVDWKDVLSRWIGENGRRQDYTYRRPSRRSESINEYLPSLQKFGVDDVIVLWDTSGSMNGRESEILGEVGAICEDLGLALRIIMCDAAIQADVTDVQDALDVAGHVIGGGGSSFMPAFKLLEEESYDGVLVVFTDGYIDVPKVKPHLMKSILWVIGEHDADPTGGGYGEVLRVNDKGVVHTYNG